MSKRTRGAGRGAEPRGAAGFTLLELLVVLALVGLVMAATVRGVRSFANSELRGSATKMSGAIRYLFDRASTTGRVHRLVIDFEHGRYWAEVSDDKLFLVHEKETEQSREEEAQARAQEKQEEEDKRKAEEDQASGAAPAVDITKYQPQEFRPKRARFENFKEMAVKPVELKGGIKVAGLFTPRLASPMSTGQGYIYFFPMGLTEAALVYLTDRKQETFYTLVVHPLTGRVAIQNRYVEAPVDAQFDDEGKKLP
jgi:prepilin-type N-terminal cleavage/methylation domain-containing protein